MPVRPMLLHRMALVSFRLFCKNLGNLQEFFGQMVYRPPLAENCPYAYVFDEALRTQTEYKLKTSCLIMHCFCRKENSILFSKIERI